MSEAHAKSIDYDAVVIRKAQRHDLDTMAEFIGQLFDIESDFERNATKQYEGLRYLYDKKSSDIIVAKHKNSVIGMITMQAIVSSAAGGMVGLIEDLYIDEAFRRHQLGTKLLNKILNIAKTKGYKRVQLVADSANSIAHAFYTKHNFKTTNLTTFHLNTL